MVESGTAREADLADRASRLFRFLARVQGVGGNPILDAADLGTIQWLGDLPASDWVRFAPESGNRPFLRLSKIPTTPAIDPPDADVRPWLVPGRLDDPDNEPGLLRRRTDVGARVLQLGDHPEILARFGAWLQRWREWANTARHEELSLRWYRAIYSMYFDVHASAETKEAVLALGCVVWRQASRGVSVRRHALTVPVKFGFDTDSGELTVRLDHDTGRATMELTDFLAADEIADPGLVRTAEREIHDGIDPFDRAGFASFMRRLLHSLGPDSSFRDEMTPAPATAEPVGYYAPALIVRSRGSRGLTRVLDTIADRIHDSATVPASLRNLVDPTYAAEAPLPTDSGAIVMHGTDTFLPLPLNAIQLQILQHVDCHTHTIVQGPPGTGKTHTAAALITHLLAQGKRVLVTAHTDRALAEVRDKLPPAMRDLCVSVAGASKDSFADLELSMERIASAAETHDGLAARRTVIEINGRIEQLRTARARLLTELLDHREQEVLRHQVGSYSGTLTELIRQHRTDAGRYGWIADLAAVATGAEAPVSAAEVLEWRALLLDEGMQEPDAAAPPLLTVHDVPPIAQFAQWQERLSIVERRIAAFATHGTRVWVDGIRGLTQASRNELAVVVQAVDRELGDLAGNREVWIRDAVDDVARGRGGVWHGRHTRLLELLEPARVLTGELGIAHVRVTGGDRGMLVALAESVLASIEKNGPLKLRPDGAPRVGFTTNRAIKDAAPLFEYVRVDGRIPVTVDQLRTFLRFDAVERLVEQLDEVWTGSSVDHAAPGSMSVRLAHHRANVDQLRRLLSVGAKLVAAGQQLRGFGLSEPDWSDPAARRALLAAFDAATAHDEHDSVTALFGSVTHRTAAVRYRPGAAAVLHELHDAVERRDVDAYRHAHTRLAELEYLHVRHARRAELDERVAAAPALRQAVAATAVSPVWDSRLADLESAWAWALLGAWLGRRDAAPVNDLFDRLDDVEQGLRAEATQLAVTKAWDRAVAPERLGPATRTDLRQYAQLVHRYGKGTGAHAERRRREIRDTMSRCRSAVPVWIMPIYRVVEQLDIAPDMFDVVVVDEASQAGVEAVFLQYLAPRIVVIGDERQVSPSGVGVKIDSVLALADQYLADDPHRASWVDPKRSLFDESGMRFSSRLTLVEHRRCVPEIIGFSNKIAYAKASRPLIPVRVYGTDRLAPIRTDFVAGAVSTKSNLNVAEADRIVERIQQCLADRRYAGKTFGVISLLGVPQAELIWNKLLTAVPPEELVRRRLRCGDAADFQGAERDVIFLSMVKAAGPDSRLVSQTDLTAVQRYNVAASRAADQLWLVHSVTLDQLTNPEDLRYQLLDYCLSYAESADTEIALPVQVREDRPVSPFASIFEQQVFNRIAARRYRVVARYGVGINTLDMVIVGGRIRVAVVCEGDTWGGEAEYQRSLLWQRDLERCGWPFFRVRQSQFLLDPDRCLEPLWTLLHTVGLEPVEVDANVEAVASEHESNRDSAQYSAPAREFVPVSLEVLLAEFDWTKPVLDHVDHVDEPVLERVVAPAPESVSEAAPAPSPATMFRSLPTEATSSTVQVSSNGFTDYPAFSGLLDASGGVCTVDSLADDVRRVVEVEGPVTEPRLRAVIGRLRGVGSTDARMTVLLGEALDAGVRTGELIADEYLDIGHPQWLTYRTPDQPRVRLRTLGARAIEQFPARELAETLWRSAASTGWEDRPALFQNALSLLGQAHLNDRAIAMLGIVLPVAKHSDQRRSDT